MRLSRFTVVVAVAAIVVQMWVSPVWAQEAAPAGAEVLSGERDTKTIFAEVVPLVDSEVRRLMQDRNFPEALKAIEEASKGEDAPRDYLAYLKGRAHFLAGDYDAAVAVFQEMQTAFPKSPWLRRARFAAGVALSRKGDFRQAAASYRPEVEYLFGAERKHEIAEVYLEFADAAFKPAEETEKPNYKKALTFYGKALEVGPELGRRVAVELRVARCYQELGEISEAAELYEEFSQKHSDDPLDVEARYRLGECRMAEEDLVAARRAWQDLLAAHPDSSSARIAEAMFNLGKTWGMPRPEDEKQLSLGVAALEAFIKRFPDHEKAPRAFLDMGIGYTRRNRHDDAVKVFTRFLGDERYAESEEIAEVRCLLGLAYQLQKKFDAAIEAWREYLAKHPTDSRWNSIQERIIDTEYLKGVESIKAGEHDAARKLLGEFLAKHPLDDRCPDVLYLYGRISLKEKKYEEAITEFKRLVSKYPDTHQAGNAQYMIAATLERRLDRLDDALKEYRKVRSGEHFADAKQAAARLTAKEMTVFTERAYRLDEVPRIGVTTRNVESISVRAYKVDMETYFRKMHRTEGVEALDIALIAPDLSFEYAVPDYEEHREAENSVELPVGDGSGPGVMAVTVSSKTQEATTLVIRSDLDVIVKSSHNEVFVFAENMLTGKPWPGVRLLISDGKKVFAQETTGEDGVFQKYFGELALTDDIRVLAVAEGHVASNVAALTGEVVTTGLVYKGYIYTDRPAYRAGHEVHVRGCIRDVVNDAYAVPQNKLCQLIVFNSQSRPVHRREVTLGPYGTFHDRFVLSADATQGEYRIQVEDRRKRSYQGSFTVDEYKLEPIRLTVDSPRRVYFRGETIEGTIKAEYYYGAPLAGHEVRYQLADDRSYTATTDEKGEVRFELSTREFYESQVLPLAVELPQRNLTREENFFLADRGFSVRLSTAREIFTAGETFDVTVNCNDAEGKPAARELTLKLFERTRVDGKAGRRLVEEFSLKTDDGSGLARQNVKVAKGGRYLLRAEGTDRFGNPVSGQSNVVISGEEDEVRLRILADRHSYKAGETAEVRVVWREKPALALVTFQGARVLEYRLVELATGENRLQIPMTAELAPNFELDVAVMSDLRKIEEETARSRPLVHPALHALLGGVWPHVPVLMAPQFGGGGMPGPDDDPFAAPATQYSPPGDDPFALDELEGLLEPIELEPVPNALTRGRFHQASSPFEVVRELRVEISAKRKDGKEGPIEPGQEIEVSVSTADPLGKPLAAEVGLAMVEESLLDRFEWPMPPIGEFFRGEKRKTGVSTTSSINFAYHPQTNPINPRLLSEAAREELAREERESLDAALSQNAWGTDRDQGMAMGGMGGFGGGMGGGMMGNDNRRYFRRAGPGDEGMMDMSGSAADFDSLMDLITATVEPDAWEYAASRNDPYEADWARLSVHRRRAYAEPGAKPEEETSQLLHETGYWNPSIVTGEDGKATVTFTVPERSTAWKLLAKGITTETLAGEATSDVAVSKDLFAQLKLPGACTDGDAIKVPVAIHNRALSEGQIEVTLKTTIGTRSVEQNETIKIEKKGIHEAVFAVDLKRPEQSDDKEPQPANTEVTFELTLTAGERGDVVRRTIPLLSYGMQVFATAAGTASSDTIAWVEDPEGMRLARRSLQILVGPTVERSLLDAVLDTAPGCQLGIWRTGSALETVTSDLMGALALRDLLRGGKDSQAPVLQALDRRVRDSLAWLVAQQRKDGGWDWIGRGGKSNDFSTARAFWAISLARSAGYVVPENTYDTALAHLKIKITATGNTDYEIKAVLLHALSTGGAGDFALANRLHRSRNELSTGALVHLALAFVEMDRKETAGELLQVLAGRDLDAPSSAGSLPWNQSPAELRALHALAIQEVSPAAPEAKKLADWLMAHRTGQRWSPDKATGPALMALAKWFSTSRFEGQEYRLAVTVNGTKVTDLEVDPAAGTRIVDVPGSLLTDGKQEVNFQITGRGRYSYQCILAGHVPAEQLKSTTKRWSVERTYQPAPLEIDGKPLARGFDVLTGTFKRFYNPLAQLPVGRRGIVELQVGRTVSADTSESQLEYLVLVDPIPAGTSVVEGSVKGLFDRYEISPGAITFYMGNYRAFKTIRYELHGYVPGEYRAAPAAVRDAHDPGQLAVTKPAGLAVLPYGEKSGDAYRLTPRELFELGNHFFAKGDLAKTEKHLGELIGNFQLRSSIYQSTVEMLLDAHLELGPADKIVHYFEIVKERWPDHQIPFDKVLKIGAAYGELEEFERSYLVYRAMAEGSFLTESGLAAFLDSQGEFIRSVDAMSRLLREYPPESYIADATYALAQRVHAKAAGASDDAALREKKINRIDLIGRASMMLESFLTAYPDDPAADQAAFARAGALLEAKAYEAAANACDRYAVRYPKSELLDAYWYVIGYCHFAMGEHKAAMEMCRRVAGSTRVDEKTGQTVVSPNKWQAVFILGQIHHSLGQAAEAVREYRRVEDRFDDAKKSIEYFLRKEIGLPEVTTLKPGEPVEVELKFRNIASCDRRVYRIDLMKFGLLKRNLAGISRINLSGIRPLDQATIELGDGKDYRDRTHQLQLPLKEEGVYLVVCRGDDLHASGLVLVTPLEVEIQTDAGAGQVRVTVKDAVADRLLPDVHVKVIGSRNLDFVSGSTDLRGVFVAGGISGSPTVIARTGEERYAFHRAATSVARSMDRVVRQTEQVHEPRLDLGSRNDAEKLINAALASGTEIELVESPLQEVADYLEELHGIPIRIDTRALEDVGLSTDEPVTISVSGVTLKSALRLILRDLDLTYTIQDEVLKITTPDQAEDNLATRVYPVGDLIVALDDTDEDSYDFDSLIDVITATVAPDTWEETTGGPGTIEPFTRGDERVLVFRQTDEVHQEVARLLATLRGESGGEFDQTLSPQGSLRVEQYGGPRRPARRRGASRSDAEGTSTDELLLERVMDANRGFRDSKMKQLDQMYKKGGAMGGMGGGMGAGGVF